MKLTLSVSKIMIVGVIILTIVFGLKWQQTLGKFYQVDFAAYWSAGKALNEGIYRYSYTAQDNHGNLFRHSMFLNPPIVAQPFRLIALLPYHQAKTTWYYLQIAMFVGTILLLAKNNKERVIISAITIIGMPFVYWPLFAELERGETNMIILAVTALTYYLWRRNKLKLAGFILGLGSVLKFPLLLLFAIPFVLKQWRFIFIGILTFVGIFTGSLIIDGKDINKNYFVDYLPGIALKDRLPDEVFSIRNTVTPPMMKWEDRIYNSRYKFMASSGSATRFFRSWSGNKLDRSLILGGSGITALTILIGYYRVRKKDAVVANNQLWKDIAWSAVVMATLILHTLSWITNYVVFIFIILLLWRYVLVKSPNNLVNLLKIGLLVGTAAIVVGDPLMKLIPQGWLFLDILVRNRVWLGGLLVWGILLTLLVWPVGEFIKKEK